MPSVETIFWRAVTNADFFNIERGRRAAPIGGGGQSYISISFRGLTHEDLGEFLGVVPPTLISATRPTVTLESVGVVNDPTVRASLTFAARYRPPRTDDRYRVSRQNRQFQARHPAWSEAYGFPRAPNNVMSSHDPRMPDLTHLKVYVIRLNDGAYLAGFVNAPSPPPPFAGRPELSILFQPFREDRSAGMIQVVPPIELAEWAEEVPRMTGMPTGPDAPPEVVEAREATSLAAGKRPRGQGRRVNVAERQAVERHAMDVATDALELQGWTVEDVSPYRPYDLHCTRGDEGLRVEVKGTTGDGHVVLLTPGEVIHARGNPVCLIVIHGIQLETDPDTGIPAASGGTLVELRPWEILDEQLRPTGFEFRL